MGHIQIALWVNESTGSTGVTHFESLSSLIAIVYVVAVYIAISITVFMG